MTDPHLEHSIFGGHEDARETAQAEVRSRSDRRRPARPKRRSGRRTGCLFVALVVVAVAAFAAYTVLRPVVNGFFESNDYAGPGTGEVQVIVNDGDTGSTIGATLQKAGVVKSAGAYLDAAAGDSRAAAIQPGSYTMKKQMTARAALAILLDPKNRTVPRVTVREGLWKSEVFAALSKGTGVPVDQYTAAAKDTAAIGLPAAANGNVEGYLFPATYEFPVKATATEQLRTMVAKALDELANAGVSAAQMEHTMIVASIVEAEAKRPADRPKVARVIENRLKAPMRLQLDSTVSYGVQRRSVTTTNAERADNNGWNTYLHDGLPQGPINSPGASAIEAAAAPTPGPWLYFVAVNPLTGETRFAATFAEHQRNVTLFQQFCQAHKGTC